ncbi:hypothetical protein F5Y15DRAFT_397260 [Xylariaceae sp. FL0016]|nr:hypothetical protein F5Y15DRAFT_397260 [Xylariaceae sp. FL0016]
MTTEDEDVCDGTFAAGPGTTDIYVQLVLSFALGISAFVGFCILRPRWKTLYAARKRHNDPQIALPALPDSFLGWIPALYKVTEEQILASAGLDAYVFLSFFKMAMRLFLTMLFFSVAVLLPIHNAYDKRPYPGSGGGNGTNLSSTTTAYNYQLFEPTDGSNRFGKHDDQFKNRAYLWSYMAFTWFFSLLTIYFMNSETFKVIQIRQDYLGTQSTVTDRTFRLTGIPEDIRSEEKIKEFVENLEIGHVRAVTLCRDWSEIDALMVQRQATLRKLEEAWSVYLAQKPSVPRAAQPLPEDESNGNGPEHEDIDSDDDPDSREGGRLLAGNRLRNPIVERKRPKVRLRFGFLKMRNRTIDALDYYEEKLRQLDENIQSARKKHYTPTDTAFVSMDSIAACQMAMQATVDPRPGQLLSKPAPAPPDVVWKNTYSPRYRRRLQSWAITIFITLLTIVWLVPVAALAQLLSICNIRIFAPTLAESLERHEITKALVQTGLPTLVVSLLNVLVPYLYDFLSNIQGMVSQGDVELSVISKNFFFVFFNIFVVYGISGGAALSEFIKIIRDSLTDTSMIATKIVESIRHLNAFYLNFIMLQAFGLFPFKLLQFGSVFLYPIYRMGAKTPRDFTELVQPALFNYGFYLPNALLIFILCLVYSILPWSEIVLLLGVCYFALGYFVHKYQLLYSMDQPQHATGGAWPIICGRVVVGLIAFQVVMIAVLVLSKAFTAAGLIVPLIVLTLWYNSYFSRRFTPLVRFIALRSIRRATDPGSQSHPDQATQAGARQTRLTRRLSTVDEDKEKGMTFMNPSLFKPLEQPWIYQDPPPPLSAEESAAASNGGSVSNGSAYGDSGSGGRTPELNNQNSVSSSFSLGDTHVWRDNGDNQV